MASTRARPTRVPDPFEIAILLTLVVLIAATLTTEHSLTQNVRFWGEGLWSLLTFMTQMSLVLLGGFVLAVSKPVQALLQSLVKIPKSNNQVYLMTFFVASLACWLNWGLGLVSSAFFTLEMAREHKKINFPLLVAISYMGFIFWHAGLSGSIPLVVGTPGNFSEQWLGTLIGLEETVFSWFNLSLILTLLVALSVFILVLAKRSGEDHDRDWSSLAQSDPSQFKFVDKQERSLSQLLYWVLLALFSSFVIIMLIDGTFSLGLNQINLLLIGLGLFLHRSLTGYMSAVKEGCAKLAPILIQYPLYAGIMGIIISSGLAVQISDAFISISTVTTYPLFMFLSAGLVNFFVPSGGGQWAVQAPVVIEGAKQLGVPLTKVIMAVAWGDAWTNLAQPFWALPLLAIAGVKIQDILGYCLLALLVSGLIIGGFFLIF